MEIGECWGQMLQEKLNGVLGKFHHDTSTRLQFNCDLAFRVR